jgi:hypothetical protein
MHPRQLGEDDRPDFAYTPYVPTGEEKVKNPAG